MPFLAFDDVLCCLEDGVAKVSCAMSIRLFGMRLAALGRCGSPWQSAGGCVVWLWRLASLVNAEEPLASGENRGEFTRAV